MKKLLLFGCVMTLLFVASSCSKNDEVYSCNSAVNEWAQKNYSEIRRIDRAQFLKLESGSHQRAAFRVFTPEQRLKLWQGKCEQLLSLDIWSEKEILHIKKLQSLITNNTSWFDDKTHKTKTDLEMQDDEITLISYTWREYAIEELGWNDKLLYLIAGDPNDLNSRNIAAVKAGNSGPMEPGDEDRIPDCNCTPAWRACSPHDCSDSIECTQTDSGCGWVWVTKCTGRCEP